MIDPLREHARSQWESNQRQLGRALRQQRFQQQMPQVPDYGNLGQQDLSAGGSYQPPSPERTAETAAAIAALATAAYEYFTWQRYKNAVGVENTSARGWRIWKDQQKALLRAQPRRNVRLGWVGAGVPLVSLWLASIASSAWWLVPIILGIALSVWGLGHRRPAPAQVQRINAWHRAGTPQGTTPWTWQPEQPAYPQAQQQATYYESRSQSAPVQPGKQSLVPCVHCGKPALLHTGPNGICPPGS
jgi:hypothetical protein